MRAQIVFTCCSWMLESFRPQRQDIFDLLSFRALDLMRSRSSFKSSSRRVRRCVRELTDVPGCVSVLAHRGGVQRFRSAYTVDHGLNVCNPRFGVTQLDALEALMYTFDVSTHSRKVMHLLGVAVGDAHFYASEAALTCPNRY